MFAAVPGVVVQDDPAGHDYPLATRAAGRDEIFVGRVRRDASLDDGRGIAFWVSLRSPRSSGKKADRGPAGFDGVLVALILRPSRDHASQV